MRWPELAKLLLGSWVVMMGCEPRSHGSLPQVRSGQAPALPPARSDGEATRLPKEIRREARDACAERPGPEPVALPERVTLGDFWGALSTQVAELDTSALVSSFDAFAERHGVDPEAPGLRHDFMRLWVAFEATRDGGWWRLRWDITDEEPSSIKIWKSWLRSPPEQSFGAATAVAECDEITALFSVTARRLGVRGVGLFYPTWNHVIAGWVPEALAQRSTGAVVLVPTTQIFQGCEATFDETTFAAPRRVYEYPRKDISDATEMPPALAAFLLEQVRAYGEASPPLLALIRAKRAQVLQSSLGDCEDFRRQLAAELRSRLTCADHRALRHLAAVEGGGGTEPPVGGEGELREPASNADALLSWLAAS